MLFCQQESEDLRATPAVEINGKEDKPEPQQQENRLPSTSTDEGISIGEEDTATEKSLLLLTNAQRSSGDSRETIVELDESLEYKKPKLSVRFADDKTNSQFRSFPRRSFCWLMNLISKKVPRPASTSEEKELQLIVPPKEQPPIVPSLKRVRSSLNLLELGKGFVSGSPDEKIGRFTVSKVFDDTLFYNMTDDQETVNSEEEDRPAFLWMNPRPVNTSSTVEDHQSVTEGSLESQVGSKSLSCHWLHLFRRQQPTYVIPDQVRQQMKTLYLNSGEF